jgi:hypothetical protein
VAEIIWRARADADFQRLYETREDYSEGLGDRLQPEVMQVLELIELFPARWRIVHPAGFRRAFVGETIGLVYRVEARGIVLHAMFDLREDPRQFERLLDELSRGLLPPG